MALSSKRRKLKRKKANRVVWGYRTMKDFFSYLKAVFVGVQQIVFTVFDIIGLVIFFYPNMGNSLGSNLNIVRFFGAIVFG
jgi:hypothetical protein